MAEKGGQGQGTIVFGGQYEKPKSFIEAFSELEQLSAVLGENEVPEQFFTLKQKFDFLGVGILDSIKSTVIAGILTPISVGVIKELIPIFGDVEPTAFDKVFSFLLTIGFSIGYALLVASLSRYYFSNKIVKNAMRNFLSGLMFGKIFLTVVFFILYHFFYFWLRPENVIDVVKKFRLSYEVSVQILLWINKFREVFLISAWFLVFTALLFVVIPWVGILWNYRKVKALERESEI
jgi:vacuolar-type H+-ATPase subunit I/STV1